MTIPAPFSIKAYRDTGRVLIESSIDPVSLQAKGKRVSEFKAELGSAITNSCDFVFIHDVEITFIWFVSEEDRYQSNKAADLDNVLKPLLDAASGPQGIMIDDNQVQSIRAMWMTPGGADSKFTLEFSALSIDELCDRDSIVFVEFNPNQCYLFPSQPAELLSPLVQRTHHRLHAITALIERGLHPGAAKYFEPLTRPWHRQQLRQQGFKVINASEFL